MLRLFSLFLVCVFAQPGFTQEPPKGGKQKWFTRIEVVRAVYKHMSGEGLLSSRLGEEKSQALIALRKQMTAARKANQEEQFIELRKQVREKTFSLRHYVALHPHLEKRLAEIYAQLGIEQPSEAERAERKQARQALGGEHFEEMFKDQKLDLDKAASLGL